MTDLTVLEAKLATGTLTQEEMCELVETMKQLKEENDKLKSTKTSKIINSENTLEGLYEYLDQNCNVEFNVHVIFDFFQFVNERLEQASIYKPNTSVFKEKWDYLEIENVLKALSVFRRKSTKAFPDLQECEKNRKVELPNDASKYVPLELLSEGKGLMSEYMIYKLQNQTKLLQQETIENVKAELDEKAKTGDVNPEEYLQTLTTLKKIESGEEVDIKPAKSKTKAVVEKEIDFDDEEI